MSQSLSLRQRAASASGDHARAVAEVLERLNDAAVGHRLHPGPLDRHLALRELIDVGEDQLALPTGVAGVDDLGDVLSGEEFLELVETVFGFLDRLEAKFLGNDRQGLEPPEAIELLVDVLGHLQFHQVAHRRGNHVFVVLKMVALFRNFAEGARQVGSHAGLFGDDQGLHNRGGRRYRPRRGFQALVLGNRFYRAARRRARPPAHARGRGQGKSKWRRGTGALQLNASGLRIKAFPAPAPASRQGRCRARAAARPWSRRSRRPCWRCGMSCP